MMIRFGYKPVRKYSNWHFADRLYSTAGSEKFEHLEARRAMFYYMGSPGKIASIRSKCPNLMLFAASGKFKYRISNEH